MSDYTISYYIREWKEPKEMCRYDAGVPGAARGRHHARDEIRENARQDEVPPAVPGPQAVDLRGFLEVRGNGHGAGDHIEENVPLRTEKHQQHGGNLEAASQAEQKKKNNRKERRGGNGGGHLHQRLCVARQAGTRTDRDAHWNSPQCAEDERGVNAQKSERGALQKIPIIFPVKIRQFASGVENGKTQTNDNTCRQQIADPAAQAVLLWSGKSLRGTASAECEGTIEPVEHGSNQKPVSAQNDRSTA